MATKKQFGWVPVKERSLKLQKLHFKLIDEMPHFFISGQSEAANGQRLVLWDCSQKLLGKHVLTLRQNIGSCLKLNTPVRMADGGEKAIQDIQIGDYVVSHTGQLRQVTNTFKRLYTGNMVTIASKRFPFPVTMTADHPIITMDGRESHGDWWPKRIVRKYGGELEAGDHIVVGKLPDSQTYLIDIMQYMDESDTIFVDGQVRSFKCNNKNAIHRYVPVNEKLGRLIGLYLAEGCVNNQNQVFFTYNSNEVDLQEETVSLLKELFDVDAVIKRQSGQKETATDVIANNVTFGKFLKLLIPGDVYTKRVPAIIMSANESVKTACLDAWITGDGYRTLQTRKDHVNAKLVIRGYSVCPGLARDMTEIGYSLGYSVATNIRKPVQYKGSFNSKEGYLVSFSGKKAAETIGHFGSVLKERIPHLTNSNKRITPYGYVVDITDIQTEYVENEEVYDIEVEEEHTFIAGGICQFNCVSQGATNGVTYLSLAEAVLQGQREKFIQTYAPYVYGRCRLHAGIRGKGDGSSGSGAAKAVKADGVLRLDFPGLTGFEIQGETLNWDGDTEYQWSDGSKIGQKFLDEGRIHLVKSTALITTYEQARDAILNGYPVTVASGQGFTRNEVKLGRLWGLPYGGWSHMMCFIGVDDDPQRPGLYCQNSWGADAHPRSPDGAPPGGFWVDASVCTKMFREQDSYAYSQFDGFPETRLDKKLFKLI